MSNFDTAEKLLSMARICHDDLTRAYDGGNWNMAIRRAQEVVELYLKVILKMIGIEYPKSHDIGTIFTRVCLSRCK